MFEEISEPADYGIIAPDRLLGLGHVLDVPDDDQHREGTYDEYEHRRHDLKKLQQVGVHLVHCFFLGAGWVVLE